MVEAVREQWQFWESVNQQSIETVLPFGDTISEQWVRACIRCTQTWVALLEEFLDSQPKRDLWWADDARVHDWMIGTE